MMVVQHCSTKCAKDSTDVLQIDSVWCGEKYYFGLLQTSNDLICQWHYIQVFWVLGGTNLFLQQQQHQQFAGLWLVLQRT